MMVIYVMLFALIGAAIAVGALIFAPVWIRYGRNQLAAEIVDAQNRRGLYPLEVARTAADRNTATNYRPRTRRRPAVAGRAWTHTRTGITRAGHTAARALDDTARLLATYHTPPFNACITMGPPWRNAEITRTQISPRPTEGARHQPTT